MWKQSRTRIVISLATLVFGLPVQGRVVDIVVGVTPNCPEGFQVCWSESYQALTELEHVTSVASKPDPYNCTATIQVKDADLPPVSRWREQFEAKMQGRATFRGVEVTLEGTVAIEGDNLLFRSTDVSASVILLPFENKLQWNFRKRRQRGAEESEKTEYAELLKAVHAAGKNPVLVRIVGPLSNRGSNATVEVRELFLLAPATLPN
jgi:hypothetical protein